MKNNQNKKVVLIASICLLVLIIILFCAFYSMNMTIVNGNLKAEVTSTVADTYSSSSNMLIIGDSRMVGMAQNSKNKASYVAIVGGHYQGTYGTQIDTSSRVEHMEDYMKKIVSNKGYARVFVVATGNDYLSGDPTYAVNAQIDLMKKLRSYAKNNNINSKIKIYGCSLIPIKGKSSVRYNEALKTKLKTANFSYLAIKPKTVNYTSDGIHFMSSTARDIYNIMNEKTNNKTTTTKKVTTTKIKKTTNKTVTVKRSTTTTTKTPSRTTNCVYNATSSTDNTVILNTKCYNGAYVQIVNLKVKGGSLIGKKQINEKQGKKNSIFKFNNIPNGSYYINVKYIDNDGVQKTLQTKQINVKGKATDFYGNNNKYELLNAAYNQSKGLVYTFKGESNVNSPLMIYVWNDNNKKCRIYYNKKTAEKINDPYTSFDVIVNNDIISKNCSSSNQNNGDLRSLIPGEKYHIVLYWSTKVGTNKTGFDYFIKSYVDNKITYK